MLLIDEVVAERRPDEGNTSVRIIQIAGRGADNPPRFTCCRSNRVPAVRASLMNLRLCRRNDLLCQRFEQPSEIDMRLPVGHDELQSTPQRSKARRIRLRVVSYSRSDMA